MQILSSATGLLFVQSVRSSYKLLPTVFTVKWFSISQNIFDKHQNATILRTPFPSNLTDCKRNHLYKTSQIELPEEQVQRKSRKQIDWKLSLVLGAFAYSPKASIVSVTPLTPSVSDCMNSTPTGRISMKVDIEVVFR